MYDAKNTVVLEEFFSAHPCCLDEWVSEPIRASTTQQDWADLESPLALLLRELRRSCKCTNMHMERRIREIKYGHPWKGKPHGETFAYMGLLTQLWRRHIALGHSVTTDWLPRALSPPLALLAWRQYGGPTYNYGTRRADTTGTLQVVAPAGRRLTVDWAPPPSRTCHMVGRVIICSATFGSAGTVTRLQRTGPV
jgi:hypothetical protein